MGGRFAMPPHAGQISFFKNEIEPLLSIRINNISNLMNKSIEIIAIFSESLTKIIVEYLQVAVGSAVYIFVFYFI